METLAGARQQALAHEAEQRRLTRLVRITRTPRTDHADAGTRDGPSRSFVAAVRNRIGHALVTAGTILGSGTTEDTARSH